jgi:O-antigen ligase
MNLFRLDLILEDIQLRLGPGWLVVAVLVVLYVAFGRLVRSTLLTILVLVCTQLWFTPLHMFSRKFRWPLLVLLCIRSVLYLRRTKAASGESRSGRVLAMLIGALSVASVFWSDAPEYTAEMAASFCMGLFVAFGLLWRLADEPDVMEGFARGAMFLAAALFGLGFLVAGVSYAVGSWEYFDATHLDFGDGLNGRYRGLFYNPNAAGLIGTMLLPIIVAAPREAFGRAAWLRLPTCALTMTTIFLSGSRSAAIGAVFALALVAMYRFGVGAIVTFAVGAVAIAAIAVYAPVDDIDSTAFGHIARTKHLSTLSGRLELWDEGWQDAQGHLFVGHGWGHSRVLGDVDTERVMETGSVQGATNLHNAHLQLLVDVGIVGICLFWAFCLTVLRAGWWLLTAPRNSGNAVGVVIFASVLAMLADTWVHGAIWSMGSPTTLAFWGLCVLTLKQGDLARRRAGETRAVEAAWRVPAPAASA